MVAAALQPHGNPGQPSRFQLFQAVLGDKRRYTADDKRTPDTRLVGPAESCQIIVGARQKAVILKININDIRVLANGGFKLINNAGHTSPPYGSGFIHPGQILVTTIRTGKRAAPAGHEAVHRPFPAGVTFKNRFIQTYYPVPPKDKAIPGYMTDVGQPVKVPDQRGRPDSGDRTLMFRPETDNRIGIPALF